MLHSNKKKQPENIIFIFLKHIKKERTHLGVVGYSFDNLANILPAAVVPADWPRQPAPGAGGWCPLIRLLSPAVVAEGAAQAPAAPQPQPPPEDSQRQEEREPMEREKVKLLYRHFRKL